MHIHMYNRNYLILDIFDFLHNGRHVWITKIEEEEEEEESIRIWRLEFGFSFFDDDVCELPQSDAGKWRNEVVRL